MSELASWLENDDVIKRATRDELRRACETLTWFHAIDFGEFQSSGRFKPATPQNVTLYPVFDILRAMDLRSADCLDIGCSDGLLSFGMKARGAKSVTAADTYRLPSFLIARQLLGEDVNYVPNTQIKDFLGRFGEKSFDVICCCGVIYHMLNPMSAFTVARKAIREGGIFVLETAYSPKFDDAFLIMNTEAKTPLAELYTYWTPTKLAVVGMMKLVGFNVLSVQELSAPERLTVVGQAVHPDEVQGRSKILEKVHANDTCDFDFRFSQVSDLGVRTANVSTPVLPNEVRINPAERTIDWPYHPKTLTNPVGTTRWASASTNYT